MTLSPPFLYLFCSKEIYQKQGHTELNKDQRNVLSLDQRTEIGLTYPSTFYEYLLTVRYSFIF